MCKLQNIIDIGRIELFNNDFVKTVGQTAIL